MCKISTFIFLIFLLTASLCPAQNKEEGPVKIKVTQVDFKAGNRYAFNIPNLEFHVLLQKSFGNIRSSVMADYDYKRQDMGFSMSHTLTKYTLNPGLSVSDNLYFRSIFSDSTGIWYRRQMVTPYIVHQLDESSMLGMEFKFENDWSPNRRQKIDIVKNYDNSLKFYYYKNFSKDVLLEDRYFIISVERSYMLSHGEYNYLILETVLRNNKDLSPYMKYYSNISFRGNITPQKSPLFFVGGVSNLIGYENDEFWGRRVYYFQNIFAFKPFPNYSFSIKTAKFGNISLLGQIDFGKVVGAPNLIDLKPQNENVKIGAGAGIGANARLPFLPSTDIYFLLATPSEKGSDVKYYFGLGGWIEN